MDFEQLKECITALPPNQDPTRILSQRNSENWNRPVLVLVNALEDHVFFYKVPTDLQPIEHELGKYGVPIAVYKRCFMKDDFKISASLREDIIEAHPFREAYKEYKDANELPLVSGQ